MQSALLFGDDRCCSFINTGGMRSSRDQAMRRIAKFGSARIHRGEILHALPLDTFAFSFASYIHEFHSAEMSCFILVRCLSGVLSPGLAVVVALQVLVGSARGSPASPIIASPLVFTPSQFAETPFEPNRSATTTNVSLSLGDNATSLHVSGQPTIRVTSSSGNEIRVSCNGARFGSDLDFGDCEDAISLLPRNDNTERSFTKREDDSRRGTISLPYRLLGCEL